MLKLLRIFTLVFVALFCVSALADSTADTTVTTAQAATFDFGKALNGVFSALTNSFKQNYFSSSSGIKVVFALASIQIAASSLKMGFGGGDWAEWLATVFKTIIVSSVALSAITPLSSLTWLFGSSITLGQALENWFLTMAGITDSDALISTALSKWATIIQTIVSAKIVPSTMSWEDIIIGIIPLLGALAFQIFSIIAIGLAAIVTIGDLVASKMMMDLAISCSPLLVPWLLFRPLQFLFDAWLKTIISAGMLMIVGNFFRAAGQSFATTMTSLTPSLTGSNYEATTIMLAWAGVFLACLAFLLISGKLGEMARSLVSGSGVSGFSLQAMKSAIAPAMAAPAAAAAAPGAMAESAHRQVAGMKAAGAAAAQYQKDTGQSMPALQKMAAYGAATSAHKQSMSRGGGYQQSFSSAVKAAKERDRAGRPPAPPPSPPAPSPAPAPAPPPRPTPSPNPAGSQ